MSDKPSLAVVINNQDICRLIMSKPKDGKYELKVDFLKNEFDINIFRLFNNRPLHWNIIDPERLDISYHKGDNNKPLTIHLKKKDPAIGEKQYENLPLTRIQAPNINQKFPIPLLKLEIPTLKAPQQYKVKGKHTLISIEGCNVIEFFLAGKNFDADIYSYKYPFVHLSQFVLSFEFFATNTVISDYQKSGNFIPEDEPASRMSIYKYIDNIQVIVNYYLDPNLDRRIKKINATFIENELAEEILLMSNVGYSTESNKNIHDAVYLGGSSINNLEFSMGTILEFPIGEHNVATESLKIGLLNDIEINDLYNRALRARVILYKEIKEFDVYIQSLKHELEEKCLKFISALETLKREVDEKHPIKYDGTITYVNNVELWFLSSLYTHSEDIHIMLARYLGMDNCNIYGRYIYKEGLSENVSDKDNDKKCVLDEEGIEIITFKQITIDDYKEFHVWLLYEDRFDIDVLHGYMSRYIDEELPKILITKGECPTPLGEMKGLKKRLKINGFICEDIKISRIDKEKFIWNFTRDAGLLETLYMSIKNLIES